MEKQILKPWIIPNVDNSRIYYIEAIRDDYEGFRVLLRSNISGCKVLRITFNATFSYRNTDESFYLKLWSEMDKEILGKTFYIISNSEYVDFFNEQTLEIHKERKIIHYAIYTTSDCMDILTDQPPLIEWLD